jgi:hypothetical protein
MTFDLTIWLLEQKLTRVREEIKTLSGGGNANRKA